jgi:hypothetical protein
MWLAGSTEGEGAEETLKSQVSTIKNIADAIVNFKSFVADANPAKILGTYENIESTMIKMSSQSLALQRNIGGVVSNTAEFQNRLIKAYNSTVSLNGQFQDVVDAVQALADGMGKIVSPTESTLTKMVLLSKASQMTTKEIGLMAVELVRFGGTQEMAVDAITKMTQEARKSGLNAKTFTVAVSQNLKSVSGFGFKNGVEGIKNMVKQSMTLRTNIEAIGALKMQDSILDPEGAIEMAANFQMLGGAVGKLADPFQLMYMAQNDMEGLQKELVNSTKAAMTFNKETGTFDIATEDLYRLREQAKLTGANLEDLVNTGREAAKLDYIKEKFDLSGLPEEQQNLISQLATVGKDGLLTVDIPGYKEIKSANQEQLKTALQTKEAQDALAEYQTNQGKNDRQLAEAQLTVAERQTAIQNEIKTAVITSMSDDQRTEFANNIADANKSFQQNIVQEGVINAADKLNESYLIGAKKQKEGVEGMEPPIISEETAEMIKVFMQGLGGKVPAFDLMVPKSGQAPKVMAENKIYEGIVGDEVFMGTNLSDIFNGVKNIGSNTSAGNIGGAIDININIGGTVGGDSSNNINKIFENPKVQKQIMDTVLYKLESYKKQQGVLA